MSWEQYVPPKSNCHTCCLHSTLNPPWTPVEWICQESEGGWKSSLFQSKQPACSQEPSVFHGVPVFLRIAIRQDKDDRRQGPPSSESHLLRVLDDLFKSESYWNAWSNQPVHSMWLQKLPYNYCDKLIRSHGVNSLVIVKWKPERGAVPHSDVNHIAWLLIAFADYPTCTCEWLNLRWWNVPGQSMQSQKKSQVKVWKRNIEATSTLTTES